MKFTDLAREIARWATDGLIDPDPDIMIGGDVFPLPVKEADYGIRIDNGTHSSYVELTALEDR